MEREKVTKFFMGEKGSAAVVWAGLGLAIVGIGKMIWRMKESERLARKQVKEINRRLEIERAINSNNTVIDGEIVGKK